MHRQARFDFYERLYFHEMEAREQMTSRLQIPLALLVSTIGMLGFMAQNLDREIESLWSSGFQASFLISALLLFVSGAYCKKSAWGHEYAVIPAATTWDNYHTQCITLYSCQPRRQRESLICEALHKAIREKYAECAATNSFINETRSFGYHMTIKYFIFSAISGFFAFTCYFLGELDKGNHTKPTEIVIVSHPLKGTAVTRPPPPPPPPPPTRYVRDDRRPDAPPPPPPPRNPNGK
ncbi:hypothetical protein [Massilia pseudoviolaceinigra]|uniref:hypothetical protein n=1 Tax=Massilia pseudoviolaceinigra TaxID=3057165 RepID=UPI002796A20E|nr:hypothetical protein [Massilia sp. CCM 9206]MDQ1921663.1 hypothetical protein [Massilia sp. CCM 9206]